MKFAAFAIIAILAGLYFAPQAVQSFMPTGVEGPLDMSVGNATPDMCMETCTNSYGPFFRIRDMCNREVELAHCYGPFRSCCYFANTTCANMTIPRRNLHFPDYCPNGTFVRNITAESM